MDTEFKKVSFSHDEEVELAEEVQSSSPTQSGEQKPMARKTTKTKKPATLLGIGLVIVLLGTATGYGLSQVVGANKSGSDQQVVTALPSGLDGSVEVGKLYGSDDSEKFPDTSEGVLAKGGIGGEGSHRILREGGPTQTVYLTSSVLDLDPYVGHKVEVWGETFAAQKASWLMDVGGIKVSELNAEKPFEEEPVEEVGVGE